MARRRRSRDRRTRKSTHQVWVVGFLITAAGIWSYARYVSPVLESTPQRAASTADPKSNSGLATDQDSAANSTEEAGRTERTETERIETRWTIASLSVPTLTPFRV